MNTITKRLHADTAAVAFNKHCPQSWKARPYLKSRARNGVFNACKFTYKNGMIAILMDCDKPLGDGFQVQFHSFTGAFGDYIVAIQKAMYHILGSLRDEDLGNAAEVVPFSLAASDVAFSLRKDGSVIYLALVNEDGSTRIGTTGFAGDYTRTDENSQVAPDDELSTIADDLL